MTLRDHLPHVHHDEEPGEARNHRDRVGEEPFPGYDAMSVEDLRAEFHKHTQAQLDACEEYERNNLNRKSVLDKLRYMHTRQPWQGYDDMPQDEILARLENADDETIKAVRDYERKFDNRPVIHDRAMELHHQRQQEMGPREVPAYQPGGGSHDKLK
jgi:hypothetical protein